MKPYCLLPLLVLFTNCKIPDPVIKEVKVMVPVPCPKPPARGKLLLPVDTLPQDATDPMKAAAIKATMQFLLLHVERLETILDGYRTGDSDAHRHDPTSNADSPKPR